MALKNKYILHPFLLGTYTILFMYFHNINQFSLNIVIMPVVATLFCTAIVFLTLLIVLKNKQKSGLMTAICVLLFFSFGHFFDFAKYSLKLSFLNEKHYICFVLLWGLLLFVTSYFIIKSKKEFSNLTFILNGVTAILTVVIFAQIIIYNVSETPLKVTFTAEDIKVDSSIDKSKLPDIYYIILDGYTGNIILKDHFNFPNTKFSAFLREKNFYIADNARSNYLMTIHSLASSLNLKYLNYLSKKINKKTFSTGPLGRMARDNIAINSLKSIGYNFVHYGSGYEPTRIINPHADQNMLNFSPINEFTFLLIKTTFLKVLYKRPPSHRKWLIVPSVFSMLKKNINSSSPKFVQAHLMSPHPPFLFTQDGKGVENPNDSLEMWDSKDKYVDEIKYINGKTMDFLNKLFLKSKNSPIVFGPFQCIMF